MFPTIFVTNAKITFVHNFVARLMHNGPKCHLLLSSFNIKSINIKGSSIEKLLERFLGIKIDNNFTFEKHMNEISRKDNLI